MFLFFWGVTDWILPEHRYYGVQTGDISTGFAKSGAES